MDDLVKMQQNLEHWRQEVGKLHSQVARANAATAAAYEVAARLFDDGVSPTGKAVGDMIRALATADQTAALDKLIVEAVKPYAEALRVLISHTHECERELTEALYHADFCGESRPLTDARATLAANKKGGAA